LIHTQRCGCNQAISQAIHEPGKGSTGRDGIETQTVGMVVELFGSPLVENTAFKYT
jgi:hypothetical protein